jgi:hypothetical protein
MNDQSQLLLRSIKGPVIMITVGVLFAIDRFTNYQFHQTWPVLIIVIGLMQLLGGRAPRPGYYPPPAPPAQPGPAQYSTAVPSYPTVVSPPVPAAPPTHDDSQERS